MNIFYFVASPLFLLRKVHNENLMRMKYDEENGMKMGGVMNEYYYWTANQHENIVTQVSFSFVEL